MSPRDKILAAVRSNLPRPAVPLPEVAGFPGDGEPILPHFRRQLEAMGGRSFVVADGEAARAKVAELFPTAKVVCSAVSEIPGTRRVEDVGGPDELDDVDVGVVRSPLGVAEAGAVWLTQRELVVTPWVSCRSTSSSCSTPRRSSRPCTTPTGGSTWPPALMASSWRVRRPRATSRG